MKKLKYIQARISTDLYNRIFEVAAKQNRTMSELLRDALVASYNTDTFCFGDEDYGSGEFKYDPIRVSIL